MPKDGPATLDDLLKQAKTTNRLLAAQLKAQGTRVEVDSSDDRMRKKIRNAQKAKVPYMLIAGDDDMAAGSVSFRYRDGSQKNGVPIADAISEIVDAVKRRVQV